MANGLAETVYREDEQLVHLQGLEAEVCSLMINSMNRFRASRKAGKGLLQRLFLGSDTIGDVFYGDDGMPQGSMIRTWMERATPRAPIRLYTQRVESDTKRAQSQPELKAVAVEGYDEDPFQLHRIHTRAGIIDNVDTLAPEDREDILGRTFTSVRLLNQVVNSGKSLHDPR